MRAYCFGGHHEVAASDMIVNHQHKHHICKMCYAKIAHAKKKEDNAAKARSVAEHKKAAHDKAVKEVNDLMGETKPVKKSKARPSLYQAIDNKRDAMAMDKLMRDAL